MSGDAPAVPCPICGKPARPADRRLLPFCSRGCKAVDLNRWLSGAYVVPGPPADEEGEAAAPPPRGRYVFDDD